MTTAVDLRSERECLARPCALEGRPEFHYLHLPVTGGDAVPRRPEEVPDSYLAMVDDRMAEILRAIEGTEDNVIYFCNAGKDRTGVVSALLLSRMGVSRAEIVADYMKSADNLREELTAYAAQHPEIDPAVITPCEDHINGFLDGLKTDLR